MRPILAVALAALSAGCMGRVAAGPLFDTLGGVGATASATFTLAAPVPNAKRETHLGPTVGLEATGGSGTPHATAGFTIGLDTIILLRDNLALSPGARLVTAMALEPWGYHGRLTLHLDLTREVWKREIPLARSRHLGAGLELGPQWGTAPASATFAPVFVLRWLSLED